MTTSLSDIRFLVQEEIEDQISNEKIIQWSNLAQSEFMLRIFIPANTTLNLDTTTLSYPLPVNVREIRRFRLQSDIDNGFNRNYNPVYTLYNETFEVPVAFDAIDDLLIDYYANLALFSDISDEIDVNDRFKTLYTSYIKSMYYRLPSTIKLLGQGICETSYNIEYNSHLGIKKQVSDFYIKAIGIQHPVESGW